MGSMGEGISCVRWDRELNREKGGKFQLLG